MPQRNLWQELGFLCLLVSLACLSIDVLGLFGAGDQKASATSVVSEPDRTAWNSLDQQSRAFLDTEHDMVVGEIKTRIEHEHLLFALKFALVGGILYGAQQGLFGKAKSGVVRSPLTALVGWAAVIASSIVDLRTMSNQSFIITLGSWARRHEELKLGSRAVSLGWEAYLADQLLSSSYYPALRVSGQILTALLFGFTAALFLYRKECNNNQLTAVISGTGGVLTIILLTLAAIGFRRSPGAVTMCLFAGALGAAAVAFLAYDTQKLSVPEEIALPVGDDAAASD